MFSLPPCSPSSCRLKPWPWPTPVCIGALPCRSGKAKVDLPSPPYVVPRSEKSAVFWLSGISWPSQKAQPFGGKLNGKIRISATKGSDIVFSLSFSLVLRRENPLERNAEIQYQIRLHVQVWLATTYRTYRLRRHGTEIYSTGTVSCTTVIGPIVVRGRSYGGVCC